MRRRPGALVHNLVGGDELPRNLRDAIAARAEGNPLFVEEVIRGLVDLGGLVSNQSGGLRVMEKAGGDRHPRYPAWCDHRPHRPACPRDPRTRFARRRSSGGASRRRCSRRWSLIPSGLTGDLALLREREFVRVLRTQPQPEYSFKHVLIQEAAYEGLLLRRRRELHLKVAAAIEQLHADRLEEVYGLLAYHYTKAEAWDEVAGVPSRGGQAGGEDRRRPRDPCPLRTGPRRASAGPRRHLGEPGVGRGSPVVPGVGELAGRREAIGSRRESRQDVPRERVVGTRTSGSSRPGGGHGPGKSVPARRSATRSRGHLGERPCGPG